VLLVASAAPAVAQGKGKDQPPARANQPASGISLDVALSATKDVLVGQGFEVVRVEPAGDRQVVYYRAGNQGRGKGQGPPVRLVVQRVGDRIVLEDAPDAVRLEIGVRLGIKL
jgi:hypothetical protein